MNLGEKIRYFRKVKNLSQQELAAGICSIPYLSKIENGVTEPSEKIKQQLAERLEINLNSINENEVLSNYVDLFYSLYQRDYQSADEKFHTFLETPSQSIEEEILNKIFKSIYILMTSQETLKVQVFLNEVAYINNVIKGEKAFYYFFARGLHSYYLKKFEESFNYFLEAEQQLENNNFQEWEKGYLFYLIALSANQLYKNIVALEYTKLALEVFEKTYSFKRCADCRIILGIIHLRIKNFDESTNHLLLAETIANTFNDDVLRGAIYQNLGSIATHKGESDKAIELYYKSLKAKQNQPVSYQLTTMYTLIKEYEKCERPKEGLKLVNAALKLVNGNPIFRGFELHFMYFRHVFTYGNFHEVQIDFMINDLVPYFEQRGEWVYLAEYYPIIGKYFENNQKYKQASMYYSSAIEALRKIHELGVTYV
ncbi:helix-turn-helix transcriptional regulator [Fictibacillus barbaricus]|uniref:Transcriptional regulator with XRE-family HTH domain n=1 Tax=Fictibacillus barbaricus TaxID=182136 RepID=A0ABU1U1F3_9BACL|nr:helix-turn-helix transcriptional regulator [Fictibacillus barbaricus]MDR7073272.1 transcriptional regulator with XRE-family HTH domain [Fictibacillus barbaricus]